MPVHRKKDESLEAYKERVRLYFISYREKNREKIRQYNKNYNKEYRKLHGYINEKTWEKRNPLKHKAQRMITEMLRYGKITPQKCVVCASSFVHGHHEDYNKPKEVVWLCPLHHKQRHKEIKEQAIVKIPLN